VMPLWRTGGQMRRPLDGGDRHSFGPQWRFSTAARAVMDGRRGVRHVLPTRVLGDRGRCIDKQVVGLHGE